jgi:hypothetical protein
MWNDAVGYEAYVGHWSRALAPQFLDWLAPPARLRWLDVAFGRLPAPAKDPIAGKQWLAQYGKLFKIGGPLLVVISLILAAAKFFS